MGHVHRIRAPRSSACAIALGLSACGTVPPFYSTDSIAGAGDTVIEAPDADLVLKHIQCELIDVLVEARKEHDYARNLLAFSVEMPDSESARRNVVISTPPLARLLDDDYVAQLTITLDVTQNEGLAPQLSFVTPLKTPMTKRTLGIGGQMSGQQHRSMTESITVDLKLRESALPAAVEARAPDVCKRASGDRLRGTLGLQGIIAAGLKSTIDNPLPVLPEGTGKKTVVPIPAILRPPAPAPAPAPVPVPPPQSLLDQEKDYVLAPKFGSTIDFTVVYGLNGSPTWTLSRFIGPSPNSGGLVNWSYTVKDTLVISLVASGKSADSLDLDGDPNRPAASPASKRGAANAAQVNTVQQILTQQRLPSDLGQ